MPARDLPRFVLDTNVCLDLFVFGDPRCAALLEAVRAGEIELISREDCRAEWLAVLEYPRLALSAEQRINAMQMFDRWVKQMPRGEERQVELPRCRDPDDQKFLELAWQAQAVALLTRDDALLKLARRTRRNGWFLILPPVAWKEALGGKP